MQRNRWLCSDEGKKKDSLFFLMIRRPPRSTNITYTSLFRSIIRRKEAIIDIDAPLLRMGIISKPIEYFHRNFTPLHYEFGDPKTKKKWKRRRIFQLFQLSISSVIY